MTTAVETRVPAPAPARTSRIKLALIDRLPLLLILLLQVFLAYQLANTAFEDEALYVYAGHRELDFLLHGTPTYDTYASYFSGAPFLYPVAAAVVDTPFGLEGVRALSLLAMLGATAFVWMTARRLYGKPAAVVAAGLFAVAAPTLFLSRLATYDAPAVLLLALALWIAVRTARGPVALVLLAAPPLALAAGVKYASTLYLPTVVVVAVLAVPATAAVIRRRVWLRGAVRGLLLGGAVAGLIALGLDLAGPQLRAGLSQTTVNRAAGAEPVSNILRLSAVWGGWVFVLGAIGCVYVARRRTPEARRPGPVLLAAALTGTALLATAYQAHLGTSVSLHKHIGFGLLFAAPVAGAGLAGLARLDRLGTAGLRPALRAVPGLALGVCVLLAFYANHVVGPMYEGWPDSSGMVAALRPLVQQGPQHYLVEENEIPRYYLGDQVQPYEWLTTYFFQYTDKTGKSLVGLPAYQAAINDRYFDLVVLDFGPTAPVDAQITTALKGSGGGYHLVAKVPGKTSHGVQYYSIWQRS
ncbi:4-amino-4-deoxy-L-arabinose transferase-like glycosyltransferase [Streptacidiphilus sp. MAP12-16]|uniref:glycosyltransferase family 39 protein n=1 Tax=Streptacidiphilus sp. MAP12-16 TaxID=3156300 RepID=UPI0035183E84